MSNRRKLRPARVPRFKPAPARPDRRVRACCSSRQGGPHVAPCDRGKAARGRYLIAAPGTRPDEPGWQELEPGRTLSWGIDGTVPDVAVKRDGVLLATGLPMPTWPDNGDRGDLA